MKFGVLLLAAVAAMPVTADRLVRIHDVEPLAYQLLVADGYDVASSNAIKGWVDVYMPDDATDMAAIYSGRYEVLPREWGELLAENGGNAGAYYSTEENSAFWATLAETHADLVDTPVSIGTSVQGRDIMMIRMSSGTGPSFKPAIFFTASPTPANRGATRLSSTSPTGWRQTTTATPWRHGFSTTHRSTSFR